MNTELIQRWVRDERLSLADFLAGLSADDWNRDSLCDGWTVHDVLAHVALSNRDTWRRVLTDIIRARGDWNRMTADQARRYAAHVTPAELIAQLRDGADLHRPAPGASQLDPLVDIIIHGQDIARPLGRPRPVPTAPGIAALDHVLRSRFYGARKRLRDTRLIATDADWTHGTGSTEIRASTADLLLAATGRLEPRTLSRA
ncbi:maleylpyruvate isomerase family mycothiol-dependent enzyme [Nocardia otitidiscaviarum]|uniref:Maleylpyruvate isomerase family mycothiol-dependent enzyme n=1 Tax=Nocardia otitidiscaviarum TaxID=1823 RepID=A0A516NP65_9NOCA|nr:maleylpyruvate isomerase family mycothiol-dependent enzyme [Nocardia otitidiscaviarum]MCP9624037.1 maleylpyruvate isomerase family mycothiol-dependent enzyme [Nocardia otitidiscaviarum]QDP80700.1 maleylpyruvate isomerase family mycothiol-dependent enzyme [Nocardia otitidiscaviarum]